MKVRPMRPLEGVQGLIDICDYVSSNIKVETVLELGSYIGESTVTFAKNFKDLKILYAVDPFSLNFNSDNLFDEENIEEIMNIFYKNIEQYPSIKHIRKDSENASKDFENKIFDFIYIDGCHSFDCVMKDVKYWKPKVKENCYMSFHDIDWYEVVSALSLHFDIDKGYMTKDNSITFRVQ